MRLVLLVLFCAFGASCSDSSTIHRNYVISKSQLDSPEEAVTDVED
jgi:hypothetical protein